MRHIMKMLMTGTTVGAVVLLASISVNHAQNTKNMTIGQAHYLGHCASCHGFTGAGDGPSAKGMRPRPTNFTTATPATLSDNAIEQAILVGKANTAMHGYATIFRGQDIRAIVTYIRTLSTTP